MALEKEIVQKYTDILFRELKPAMGCTEPIAIAYAAARARRLLGMEPVAYTVRCSGNIIKNVKAVTVPQTGGLRGIEAAVLAGALGGDADKELEVLSSVTDADRQKIRAQLAENRVKVELLESTHTLHVILECTSGAETASVEIIDWHTNVGNEYHNGRLVHARAAAAACAQEDACACLTIARILEYADTVELDTVRQPLENQLRCNAAICEAGLTGTWGACVGKTQLRVMPSEYGRLGAVAAAGSDARMNGCALPVVINSGSGNQGLAASMPVYEYAKLHDVPHARLLRALCVSNLTALRQKCDIGKLSAYCGAVCAATGAAAAIAYLEGASYEVIGGTIINSIATIGGMVCDGAKSSCAAKISCAVQCALGGYELAKCGNVFRDGEGIVGENVEQTISRIGRMASRGMQSTDEEILKIMVGC
ncbi:MAG: L-serine ammonia-lyase, iron-sulfur-dependent, subunit alpha [Oscillospiraceae bacterium]|nr:L-serine ammonia-lyase, iron-sulfur-dependent, subunit alpha [Oscillospiraceae bacterium]